MSAKNLKLVAVSSGIFFVLAYALYQAWRIYGLSNGITAAYHAPALELGGGFLLWALPGLGIYLLPSFLAAGKKHLVPVLLVNLLLGWTLIFWGVALVMALLSPREELAG